MKSELKGNYKNKVKCRDKSRGLYDSIDSTH
jgi:hypothetical protein